MCSKARRPSFRKPATRLSCVSASALILATSAAARPRQASNRIEHGRARSAVFHLGTTATSLNARSIDLKSGENIAADLVVIGVGVRPAIALAEQAGLALDRGVGVSEYLETSVPQIRDLR